MKRVYTWAAEPAQRSVTVADLQAGKGKRKFTQVTANTADEAAAAEAAGIDMIICQSDNARAARAGSKKLFLTASIPMPDHPTKDDVLREAYRVLSLGADAVMTARSMEVVSMLAREDIPVMGHLGLVPRKSTWTGGIRAIGGTSDEAIQLFQRFKRLEEAGAVLTEAEVIPGDIMREITQRTSLITVSLGSGLHGDVMYLFASDICGELENPPRHARAFANLKRLYDEIRSERIRAFTEFKAAAMDGAFPADPEIVATDPRELERFLEALERQ